MTLFQHITDGLAENTSMNGLDHWFEGISSYQDAVHIYEDSFTGETDAKELDATFEAIHSMFIESIDSISCFEARLAVKKWSIAVWGQGFSDGSGSVIFNG